MHEGEGERKMREFKEKILSEEQAGRGEAAKTKVGDHFSEEKNSTWISGEHEAGDDEEQEQLDRVHEEDTGDQRGEGEEDGEGGRWGIAEESKQEAGK